MAFTFDADPQSATMNSYAAVEFADDYFTGRFGADKWFEQDLEDKEALLVSATRTLERFEYGGLKAVRTQPLKWPRQLIYDNEGNSFPSNVVPELVKQAVCEQAWWLLTEEDRMLDTATLWQYESFKAGPLDLKMKKGAPTDISPYATSLIEAIGSGILLSTGGGLGGARTMNMGL